MIRHTRGQVPGSCRLVDAAYSGQYVQEQGWRGTYSTSVACARAVKLTPMRRSSSACSSKQRSGGGNGACCIGLGASHMVVVEVLGRLEQLPRVHTYLCSCTSGVHADARTHAEQLPLKLMHSKVYYVGTGARFTRSLLIPKRLLVQV